VNSSKSTVSESHIKYQLWYEIDYVLVTTTAGAFF